MHPSGGQYGSPGWQQGPAGPGSPGGPPPPPPQEPYGPPPGVDPWGQGQPPQQGLPPQPPMPGQPPAPGQVPPQAQQPQQVALPALAGSGMGRLVIEAKASWLFWPLRAFGRPQISINGGPVQAQWGTNTFDLPDGHHNVHVVTKYLSGVGEAYVVEPVRAGQQSVLYYKAPVDIFHRGALDEKPGGHPGMVFNITALVVVAAIIVAVVVLLAVFG